MATPSQPSATTLFLQYRESGDAVALTGVFDQTAPELLALAGHLTRNLTDAEDLVQHTFLVAIEKARRFDERRAIMPWLAGILIKEAKSLRRKRARRIDPQRLARSDSQDASRQALDGELRACVESALEQLPAKYGQVLRAHLLEGANAGEIAAHTGIAPGTVRVQLHRGFDLLRRALPSGLSLAALAAFMPRGLAEVRQVVATQAAIQGPLLAGSGVAGTTWLANTTGPTWLPSLGTVAMQSKWIVGTALLFLLGWGVTQWPGADERTDSDEAVLANEASLEPNMEPALRLPPLDAQRNLAPAETAPEIFAAETGPGTTLEYSGALLRVHIEGSVTPTPTLFNVQVFVGDGPPQLEVQTPDLGTMEWALERPSPQMAWDRLEPRVLVSGKGYLTKSAYAQLLPSGAREASSGGSGATAVYQVRIELPLIQRWIVGRLLDAEGDPVAPADSWIVYAPYGPQVDAWQKAPPRTWTQSDGRFRLPLPHREEGRLLAHATGHAVHVEDLPLGAEPEFDVGTLQLSRGVAIRGRVLRNGMPLPVGSVVRANLPRRPVSQTYFLQKVQPTSAGAAVFEAETEVGEDGTFELYGLQAGVEYFLTATSAQDYTPFLGHGEGGQPVRAPAHHVVLDWGKLPLRLEISSQEQPIHGAQVRSIRPAEGPWLGYPIHLRGGWQNPARSDADGRVQLHLPTETVVHLEVTAEGCVTKTVAVDTARLPASGVLAVDLERGVSMAEVVVRAEGVPPEWVSQALAFFYTFDPVQGLKQLDPTAFRDGVALVTGMPAGSDHLYLHLHLQGHDSYADLPFIEPGSRRITFDPLQAGETRTVTMPFASGGRIELTVVGLTQEAAPPHFACIDEQGKRQTPQPIFAGPEGQVREAAWSKAGPGYLGSWLAPGTYRIVPTHPAYAADEIRVQVQPGEVTKALYALRPAE